MYHDHDTGGYSRTTLLLILVRTAAVRRSTCFGLFVSFVRVRSHMSLVVWGLSVVAFVVVVVVVIVVVRREEERISGLRCCGSFPFQRSHNKRSRPNGPVPTVLLQTVPFQ